MQISGRPVPRTAPVLLALLILVSGLLAASPSSPPAVDGEATADSPRDEGRKPSPWNRPAPPTPPAPTDSAWSGYAFDACRAPSQRVMDRWRTTSPFTGVGIYLGGVHRACKQRHLTRGWVEQQVRSSWKLLPIWVGPQATCTSYDHRISGRSGAGWYPGARTQGSHEAGRAAAAAHDLGIRAGEVIFYDIEPYNARSIRCRQSSLAFLEEWTNELHRRGYRSGVYSHVAASIAQISRTGAGYSRPDAIWYAWVDRVGLMPHKYVANAAFMRTSRVHQYALDRRVEFGGIHMDIDWDFVSLGSAAAPESSADCNQQAARVHTVNVGPGDQGPRVRVLQCLVSAGGVHPLKTSGQYDAATQQAVLHFQARSGLGATGIVDRSTWTSLLARGRAPVLSPGARGGSVERLQRSLNAAVSNGHVRVDGHFGRSTARAVRRYRRHLGLPPAAVATPRVWRALERGRTVGH
jgi:peptidoglycan hydrolase-like protein with peptidoglycan-binding domain